MNGPPPLVVCVLSGAAEGVGAGGEESALFRAKTPVLDALAVSGRVFPVRLVPEGHPFPRPASLLSLLGYEPGAHPCAPGGYLARARGVPVEQGRRVLCADIVTLFREAISDAEPGPFRPAEEEVLFSLAEDALGEVGFRLVRGAGTHHLAIAAASDVDEDVSSPQALVGRPLATARPRAEAHRKAHERVRQALEGHEINVVRRDLGENGADAMWLWGASKSAALPAADFGAPVRAAGEDTLFSGVCRAAGVRLLEGGTGDLVEAARAGLREAPLVFLHVRQPLFSVLRRDPAGRIASLERLDAELFGPLRKLLEEAGARLLTLSDGAYDAAGNALCDPVPALLWGHGVVSYRPRPFTEAGAASAAAPLEPGSGLLAYVRHL